LVEAGSGSQSTFGGDAGKESLNVEKPRKTGGGTVSPYAQDDDNECSGRNPGKR
jgi:hypothetical protein